MCAYETSSVPAIVRTQATDAGLKWFEIECVSWDKVGMLVSVLCLFLFFGLVVCFVFDGIFYWIGGV